MSGKAIAFGIIGAALSALVLAFGYAAGSASTSPAPVADAAAPTARTEIETIVREYLVANPQILSEMQVALDLHEQDLQRAAQMETIGEASERIFNAGHDGVIGNPEGSVTVVEFFDYNCGYCKRAYEDMEAMVSADPDLRFVLKEFPILGPDSQRAHVVSMALRSLAPEHYGEFHRTLLTGEGRATEASAIAAAVALGVDEEALRAEMADPAIMEAFAETYELAAELSITGTPSYVVGEEVVFGALGRDVLTEKVELARASGS